MPWVYCSELSCPAPFHSAVGSAFQEIDVRFARHPHDVFEREDRRAIDEAVDHQPRVPLVRFGHAVVIALEEDP
jgi:hypothetical protein